MILDAGFVLIIPYYNRLDQLVRCLTSIEHCVTTPGEYVVYIIDNSDVNNYIDLKQLNTFKNIRIFNCPSNLGFGTAVNLGVKLALNNGITRGLVLNQDCELEPTFISDMISFAIKMDKAHIYSPLVVDRDNMIRSTFKPYLSNHSVEDVEIINVASLPGVCLLMDFKYFLELGGFDPVFKHYGEDDDFFKRNSKELNAFVIPSIRLYHSDTLDTYIYSDKKLQLNVLRSKFIYSVRHKKINKVYHLLANIIRMVRDRQSILEIFRFMIFGIIAIFSFSIRNYSVDKVKGRVEKILSELTPRVKELS